MSDRAQIGPTVDKDLWERFRKDVEARKGQVRGVLGDELENAIREYLKDGPDPVERKQLEKLTRIEQAVGASASDGGVDTYSEPEHTHAPSRLEVDEKPPANAPTDKKIAYLDSRLREETDITPDSASSLPRSMILDLVKDEYGFRRDTAKRYVETLIERFDLRPHPNDDYDLLVTQPREEEIRQERKAQREQEAEQELQNL